MSIAEAIHLLARDGGVCSVDKRDEREALGSSRVSILGQEDSGDAAKALEHIA